MSIFDSAWIKFGWAVLCDHGLQQEIASNEVDRGDPSIEWEFDEEGRVFTLTVSEVSPMPVTYGLRFADALNAYRSALDHAMWGIASLSPDFEALPEKARKQIYFPLCRTVGDFKGSFPKDLAFASEAHRDLLANVQPYAVHPNIKIALDELIRINSHDKHREIQPIWQLIRDVNITPRFTDCELDGPIEGRDSVVKAEVGAEVCRFNVTPTGPNPSVDVAGVFTLSPSTEDGLEIGFVTAQIRRYVGEILTRLGPRPLALEDLPVEVPFGPDWGAVR